MAKRNQQSEQRHSKPLNRPNRSFVHRSDAEAAFAQVPKEERGGSWCPPKTAQSQSPDAKPSIEIPPDLSIPPFLRREQPKPQQPADATKPNESLPPQHDEPAQDVGFAGPAPPAQNADIAAPYRVSRSMMHGTPEQRRPVTQADLDEINVGLAREGIEPVRQPAPRTPLRPYEQPAIKQEAEESLKFLDDFFGTEKRHLVAIRKREDGSSEIKGRHFPALDRAGQQRFIADHEAAGYNMYFTVNPIKGELHKKASKDDVAEARWLWVDMDPRRQAS
jgi:hypothetical protein